MRSNSLKYLLSFFFIILLFAEDIIMISPALDNESSVSLLHHDFKEDESEKSRSSEEVKIEISEYIDSHSPLSLETPFFLLYNGRNLPGNTSFKRTFYGSVLTPPPNKA